jgi:5-methylcytosine-specific restriction endonuclease McrA
MIRITRGPEPATLADVRQAELRRVRAIAARRAPTSDEVGTRYQFTKESLRESQHCKCCYCEHDCMLGFHDVEHYRPKARADRGPGLSDHGYWWLAWTWDNLMFTCPGCNRSGKNDRFPLAPGSNPLFPEDQPPGNEQPLFIDPASEDPVSSIQFRRMAKGGETHWIPVARGGSPRGYETIRIARLDRSELLDLYKKHVRDEVIPSVDAVRGAITAGADAANLIALWRDRIEPLVFRTRRFAALAYDVIEDAFPQFERQQLGLSLVRP